MISRSRKRERWDRQFGDKALWIAQLNCLVCGRIPSEAAHVKSRGAGGTSEHLVPICTAHHYEQHTIGIKTFQDKYHLDLTLEALEYESRWQQHKNGKPDLGF